MPGEPIVLIYDGHGSHVAGELVNIAFKTPDIHLFCLPPKTTHKLQVLDVGVFGPVQRAWADRCDEYTYRTGTGIPRGEIVKEYVAARDKVFRPELILKVLLKSS